MIVVYRDDGANAPVLRTETNGTLGNFHNNELRAVGNEDGTITLQNRGKSAIDDDAGFLQASNVPFGDFRDQSETPLGADEASTVNALNAILAHTGGVGDLPVITSSTAITVSDGDQVNYELIATNGVGYEWSGIPAGLSLVEGNQRRLIGSITGGVGSYNVTMTAINYNGSDTETLTITVTSSYANTKSLDFANQDWMGANAALLDAALGRAGNGSGSGDAWSIHLWFKGGPHNVSAQTVFYYGSADTTNGGHLFLRFVGNNDKLRFQYGSGNNYLRWDSANNALPAGTWKHVLITYDGGTTGSSSGSISSYYGRFTIFVDGVDVTSGGTWSHSNYGWSAAISGQNLRVGRYSGSKYMRDCRVDELAVWDSDQSASISAIYNSGTTHDLSALTAPPAHWWRCGDGDTFPTIQDNVGTAHFVLNNMTIADIVNDVP